MKPTIDLEGAMSRAAVNAYERNMGHGRLIIYKRAIDRSETRFRFWVCYQPYTDRGLVVVPSVGGQLYLRKDGAWHQPIGKGSMRFTRHFSTGAGAIRCAESLTSDQLPKPARSIGLWSWVTLSDSGGEFWRGTLAEFFVSNDVCDADRAEVIRGLTDHGLVHVGGGASPVFVLGVAR